MADQLIIDMNNVYNNPDESFETALNEAVRHDCNLMVHEEVLYYVLVNKQLGFVQGKFIGTLKDLANG